MPATAAFSEPDDDALFASYYNAHYGWLSAVVRRLVPEPAEAEDVCAVAFEAAFLKRAFRGGHHVDQQRAWLYRAVQHQNWRRQRGWSREQKRYQRDGNRPVEMHPDPLDEIVEREELEASARRDALVRDIVARLQPEHRRVLELRSTGLKGPAIAERLGVTHQRARTLLMNARGAFRAHWLAEAPMGGQHHE